jgi:hypothetical protein
VNVRLRLIQHSFKEECSIVDQKRMGRLSILQRSYSFHMGFLGDSQLKHDSDKFVYPLVSELLDNLDRCDRSISSNLAVLEDCENLVELVKSNIDLDFTRLTLFLRRIKKSLLASIMKTSDLLRIAIDDMDTSLDLKSVSNLFSMWKSCAITTLGTNELFDLQTRLRDLDSKFEFSGSCSFGQWIAKMISHQDVDLVHSLLDAASTLYFLNENKGDASIQELFSVISQVPEVCAELGNLLLGA